MGEEAEDSVFVDRVARDAFGVIQRQKLPEFQWLFTLVGVLRGRFRAETLDPVGAAEATWHIAQAFADLVFLEGAGKADYLDWADECALRLEFERAWRTRKDVLNSPNLEIALAASETLTCYASLQSMNTWVWRVTMVGFLLQEQQPDRPFFIPVNTHVARRLRTSLRTLSLAINRAVELNYLLVVEKAHLGPGRRLARKMRFNYEHTVVMEELAGAIEQAWECFGGKAESVDSDEE